MKKALEILSAASFAALLGIVGAVEQGAGLQMLWWSLPLIFVMCVAALVADAEHMKKFFCEVDAKRKKR